MIPSQINYPHTIYRRSQKESLTMTSLLYSMHVVQTRGSLDFKKVSIHGRLILANSNFLLKKNELNFSKLLLSEFFNFLFFIK